MRLDKFLKLSRLIKRRTLAKEFADKGRIQINGNNAKAATRVAVGDELVIRFGQNIVTVEVLILKEIVRKDEATLMYKVLKEERTESE